MRRLMMLFSLSVGLLSALGVEAGSPPTVAEKAKIVAAAVALLALAPQNACPEGFAYIPAGPFVMGSNTGEKNELPVRTVSTDAYCMAIHETTNAEYQKIMMKDPVAMPEGYARTFNVKDFNGPQQPVVFVNWMAADAYCKKLGDRLPTEAEWEKAARGPRGLKYGTRSGALSKEEANYDGVKTTDVCSYPKNDYGLCDMAGNVYEWTDDWYATDAFKQMKSKNPQELKNGEYKVLRGGSWSYDGTGPLRMGFRIVSSPGHRGDLIGFRCVSPEASKK